jgi:hypothetical protein
MKRRIVLVLVGCLVLLFAMSGVALADIETFSSHQISSQGGHTDYSVPGISGDRIAWTLPAGTLVTDVYTWAPASGEVQLTNGGKGGYDARVSGDRVVWGGVSDSGNSEIFTWTPTGGTYQITSNDIPDYQPIVSGDRVVWGSLGSDGGDDEEIFTWTPTGGIVQVTSNSTEDYYLNVSGDRIVWMAPGGSDGGTDTEIFTWTSTGGVQQLTANDMDDMWPTVSGNRIAWDWNDGNDREVMTWTLGGGTVQITSNTTGDDYPSVSGDRIAWETVYYNHSGIGTWTPAGGAVELISSGAACTEGPRVDGDRIAWRGFDNDTQTSNVSTWTPTYGVVKVTGGYFEPVLSGDRIAWFAGGVFTATPSYVAGPSITSLAPASGPTTGGTSVVINGTGFVGVEGSDRVKFGDVYATSYVVNSSTKITALSPAHAAGVVNVQVNAYAGITANTPADDFTYTSNSSGPEQLTTTRLTTNSHDDDVPALSGDRIAWAQDDGNDYEIYTWTPGGGTVRVTNNSYDDYLPRVDGDRIVWGGDAGNADWEIFTWTPTGGTVQVTNNSLDDEGAVVSRDRIVWMQGYDTDTPQYKIWAWTPSDGAVRLSDASDRVDNLYPDVSGNLVTWVRVGSPYIYIWSPGSGVNQIDTGTSHELLYAAVSGQRIAALSTSSDVFVWDSGSAGSWLTTGPLGGGLDVSGDRVVWNAAPSGTIQQIFTWTPTGGVAQLSSTTSSTSAPRVSENRVVWVDDGASGADSEIWSWTPGSGRVAVTSNTTDDIFPSVSGNRIVWLNLASSTNGEIYTALATPALPQFENTDPHIVYDLAPDWTNYSSTSASGGSYARASARGSSATVHFNGTRLDWIAMKGTTTGKADVYLDDVFKTTVDLAASAATYKVNVWSTGTIAAGVHKFSIVWNTGNAAGKYITLDRVDVLGSLVYPAPTITSLSPASGVLAGGTSVTINGTGFAGLSGASAVTFGGVNATTYTVNSATKITAAAPAHAAGTVPVQVTTAIGSASSNFTYSAAPPTTRVDLPVTTTAGLTASGTWAAYSSTSAFGGSYLRSSTAGASVVITFKGTRLDWITMNGTTGAKADIYLDGSATAAVTALDLYQSPAVYQQNVWSTGTLPDGWHTVKIVRNSTSVSGRYLTLDAVEIAGTLQASVRLEETAAAFTFTPAWTVGTTTSASGGAYRYTNTKDATVSFSFTGVGFKIIAKTAPSYGNITVTIDNHTPLTVSLYSSATTYKKVVLTVFLASGAHTVRIARAGTKSSSSTGYTIDLDAVDLFGT